MKISLRITKFIFIYQVAQSQRWASAGITLATTIISLATGTTVDKDIAMTGEITLTGKVLPVGGIKEKALAAMRLNIKKVIIPHSNLKDLIEIKEEHREKN